MPAWIGLMTGSTFARTLKAAATSLLLLILGLGSPLRAQEPYGNVQPYAVPELYNSQQAYGAPQPPPDQAPRRLSPGDLANLVAPIALYPDPLLSQVLAASTYPQQLIEAQEFLQQNPSLQGRDLMEAAQQQNWDPSVQALCGFPDVVALLTRDIQWTADLGQAFLDQPSDVMDATQYLRAQARDNGQLRPTPELSINTEAENGQRVIEIQPANPQIMYVPAYNPYVVWGPPAVGAYPALGYPGGGFGSLFESAINLASMFAGFTGLLGPNGWGWALSWLAHTLFVNNPLLHILGFRNVSGYGSYASFGPTVWSHNASFGGPNGFSGRGGGYGNGGWRGFGGGTKSWGGQSRASFAPQRPRTLPGLGSSQRWAGSGGFQAGNRAADAGKWRSFRGGGSRPAYDQGAGRFAQPSWGGNRDSRAWNHFSRGGYPTRSESYAANYSGNRTPFANSRSRQPSYNYRGFSTYGNETTRSAPRSMEQTSGSWGRGSRSFQRESGSFQPRTKSRNGYWGSSGSRQSFKAPKAFKPPKQERFKAPHFKEPRFKEPHFKSHGGGGGGHHSGGKSHRR